MHSLFFVHNTLRNDYLGQGRCRFIQVNNCSPGTGRHLYCTVLYCSPGRGRHRVACGGNYNKEIEMA